MFTIYNYNYCGFILNNDNTHLSLFDTIMYSRKQLTKNGDYYICKIKDRVLIECLDDKKIIQFRMDYNECLTFVENNSYMFKRKVIYITKLVY